MPISKQALKEVISNFEIPGEMLEIDLWGSGHIHDTYASRFLTPTGEARYIHQWINQHVFKDPLKVMQNIDRVTRFARDRILANGGNPQRETLTLVPGKNGQSFYQTPGGDFWRTYIFIDGARTYDQMDNPRHVYNAAKAFGKFQMLLNDMPGDDLYETIPGFHDTPRRYLVFQEAVQKDSHNRARDVQREIAFFTQREADMHLVVDLLSRGEIPQRVTHNDTKLNNVLIDDETGEGICVIDLDTVMPGSALYDFGDCVRLGASSAAEDEPNLDQVTFDLQKYKLLADGYLEPTRDFLTQTEIDYLAFSAKLITLELAMRFLMDHLNGDAYFRIHRPGHNLDRARNQIKMVQEIENNIDQMNAIIRGK